MHIVQVTDRVLPAHKYGGTERVMWSLAKALVEMGHQITFLAARNTTCDFARVIEIDPSRPIIAQIPHDADIATFISDWGILAMSSWQKLTSRL